MNYLWIGLAVVAVVLLLAGFLFWKFRSLDAEYKAREEKLKNFRKSLIPGTKVRFLSVNGEIRAIKGNLVRFDPTDARHMPFWCSINDLEQPY